MITSQQNLERINHAKVMFSGLLFFHQENGNVNLFTVSKSANIFGLSTTVKTKVPASENIIFFPTGKKVDHLNAKLVQTTKRTHGEIGINPVRRIYSDGTTGSALPFSLKKTVNHLNIDMNRGIWLNSLHR